MFSTMAVDVGRVAYEYPSIPEYTPRELLMLEKECSGMYFTGHMLDGYSRHMESVKGTPIMKLADPEQSTAFAEKDRVTLTGMISEVSLKSTKNEERMAFFTVEDKYAGIECILFPKAYEKYGYLVRLDSAVVVMGSVSRRDEEGIKILVNAMTELEDNESFLPSEQKEQPKLERSTYRSTEAPPATARVSARPTKIFLRVPSMIHEIAKKATNLVEIFEAENIGSFSLAVCLYDTETKMYRDFDKRLDATDYVIRELKTLLGEENVVLH